MQHSETHRFDAHLGRWVPFHFTHPTLLVCGIEGGLAGCAVDCLWYHICLCDFVKRRWAGGEAGVLSGSKVLIWAVVR